MIFFGHDPRPIGQQIASSRIESRISLGMAFAHSPSAVERVASGELASGQIKQSVDDVQRIIGLPLLEPLTLTEYETFCRSLMKEEAWARGERLNVYQVMSALAYLRTGGMFGPLAVGTGKTLILQLIASLARRAGKQKICLLLPRDSIDQLLDYDLKWIMEMIPWNLEGPWSFKNKGPEKRMLLATSPRRGLFLLPYSLLSTKDDEGPDLLQVLKPDVILADECYFLKNIESSACAKRVNRYLIQHRPQFVAVAGSITSKGPDDYAHLMEAALHDGSPLPLEKAMLAAWSMVISSGAMPSGAMAGPLLPLVRWARVHFPAHDFPEEVSGFRKAFMFRMQSTPGVVATTEDAIPTSLAYCNVPVPDYESHPKWPELKALIDQANPPLRLTPNGEAIAHKIHAFKWLYELSNGFYNQLVWPEESTIVQRRKCSDAQATQALVEGKLHLDKRKAYYKILRDWFDEGDHQGDRGQYLDTPELVGDQMHRTADKHVDGDLYRAWRAMKDSETPTMVKRDKKPQRICDFKIQHCLNWARTLPKSDPGAIVWVHHTELGEWAYEIFREALGPDRVLHCPAGDQNKAALRDPKNADKICIASISSHFHTLNLQHFGHLYYLQFSRNATHMEQSVGRVHRQKQPRDHIDVMLNLTLVDDMAVFGACFVDALYQHQTGGGRQKLLYGDWRPRPDAIPLDAIREMGAQPVSLDAAHKKMYSDKFAKAK